MVKEQKLKEVEKMKQMIEKHSVIGIVDMHKLPSKQMQKIKKKVKGTAEMKMTKKTVLLHAIESANKKDIKKLLEILPQQPAIIFSDIEPFKLYLTVDKLKSNAPAKAGDTAPEDIVVKAGPTNLLPGPAISELSKVGIPAGVEEGKIAVKKDTTVAKKGQQISAPLASALRKLNVEPILVGMNIVAIYQDGMIYKKDILSLVGDTFVNKLKQAFSEALNLSVAIAYPTKENIGYLLAKASMQAEALNKKIGGK